LVGAAIVGALAPRGETTYQASAVVVATKTSIPLENLGSTAQVAFGTDTVVQPVIRQLGLHVTARDLLSSGQLAASPVSGTGALTITGRSREPRLATDLVNAAVQSFIAAAEKKGLGTFTQFGTGASPSALPPPSRTEWAALGFMATLSVGLVLLLGLYFIRRPVMTKEEAREVLAPIYTLRVRAARAWPPLPWRAESNGVRLNPGGFLDGMRLALADFSEGPNYVCWVYVGPENHRLQEQVFGLIQDVYPELTNDSNHGTLPTILAASDPLLEVLIESKVKVVVTLVVARVPLRSLITLNDELEASPRKRPRIVVFVG